MIPREPVWNDEVSCHTAAYDNYDNIIAQIQDGIAQPLPALVTGHILGHQADRLSVEPDLV